MNLSTPSWDILGSLLNTEGRNKTGDWLMREVSRDSPELDENNAQKTYLMGWGDGSVGNVFAAKACRPELELTVPT